MSCFVATLPQVGHAQAVAIDNGACPANPGAVVTTPATSGVAIGGAADCPLPGTTPSAQVNDPGGIAIGNDRANPTITDGTGGSIAIGNNAHGGVAGAGNASAFGTNAQALDSNATALGAGSIARTVNSVAIGGGEAIGRGSVAIGQGAVTGDDGDSSRINQVAIGLNAAATAQNSIAIGTGSVADGPQATALGSAASAGVNSTATGRSATAGNSAVAYGVNANAGLRGTALGQGATATVQDSTAVGSFASASFANSVALGRQSVTSRGAQTNYTGYGLTAPQTSVGEVSIGTAAGQRQLTGVAAGSAATDAVNVSQLTAIDAQADLLGDGIASALGGGTTYDAATGTLTAPSYTIQGANQTSVGGALSALDTQVTTNTGDIAANGGDIANLTTGITNGTVGLVQQAIPGADLTVGATTDGATVSFAGTGGDRRLTNVAAGAVSAVSTEAVNGSQLFTGNTSVATALGGGTVVNADGTLSAPSYTIQGATQTSVGGALTALDGQVTTNTADIATNAANVATNTADIATNTGDIANLTTGITNGTIGLVQQAAAGADLTVGAATDGAAVSFAGTGGDRRLNNVAAGAVSVASSEAINGSQLFAGNTNLATALGGGSIVNPDGTISAPSYTIQGAARTNVGAALTALDGQVTTNTADIATNTGDIANLAAGIGGGTVGLVQQSAPGAALTVGAATDGTSVSFAGTGGDRRLTNVAAGAVAAASSEAINGSQLYAGNTSLATALGGGTLVNPDGTLSAPSYAIQGGTQTSVGGALTALDGQVTTNTANITANTTGIATNTNDIADLAAGIGNGSVGLVRQSAPGADLTVGAATDGTAVSFAGTGGDRRLTNVAAGTVSAVSTEAVNGSQLYAGNASLAAALGGGAAVNPDGTLSAPSYMVQGASRTNVGDALTALDTQVTTNTSEITDLTNAIGSGAVGLVRQASPNAPVTVAAATGGSSVDFAGTAGSRTLTGVADGAVGAGSVEAVNGGQLANTAQSVANALGGGAVVNPDGSVSAPSYAIQGNAQASVGGALTALDTQVTANTTAITGLGTQVAGLGDAINTGKVGLVQQAAAGAPLTVGATTDGDTVDFAGTAGDRKLTGIAAGTISGSSTDAINGSQLSATNQQIENLATLVTGNGNGFSSNNTAGAGIPMASGAEAAAGGNGAVASGQQAVAVGNNTTASGAQSTALGYAASTTGVSSVAIGAGSSDGGQDNVVSVGSAGAERRVTNVAMGVDQTDAVNLGQLTASMNQTLTSANAYTDRRFSDLAFDIEHVRRDNEGATAASMALAGIPQSFERGMGMVGMGVGTWQGESAVALGISKATDGGFVFKAGATYSSRGQGGANGGVGIAF